MFADAVHPNPEVARRLEGIYSLHVHEMDLRLGEDTPYGVLLSRLGNPHKKLPPIVHVAGTNGKGSTIAFLRAITEAAGYKVHVYTSPQLLRFNERVRIAGDLITDAQIIEVHDRILAINAGNPVTFFEFTTALAFLAFAETPADIVLLETGMGGRLDCTNVVEHPALTILTKISYDHMKFLGDTLPKIAFEKAGIIKAGSPCLIAAQMFPDEVLPVFEARAVELGAPLYVAGRDFPAISAITPNLLGAHQLENAATAAAAVYELNKAEFGISADAITQGLTHADWPGRLQHITQGPIAALMPKGWDLWFDAAHNDSGALALAAQINVWKQEDPDRPVHLLVAMSAHKDPQPFFEFLEGAYDTLTLVDLPQAPRPQTAKQLVPRTHLKDSVYLAASLAQGIEHLPENPRARVVLAGSLYLYQYLFNAG